MTEHVSLKQLGDFDGLRLSYPGHALYLTVTDLYPSEGYSVTSVSIVKL
jgi:hypothetical protein